MFLILFEDKSTYKILRRDYISHIKTEILRQYTLLFTGLYQNHFCLFVKMTVDMLRICKECVCVCFFFFFFLH